MNLDIKLRLNQLTSLQNYHMDVDKEVTMILQNLQWDRKHLAERRSTVACQYDINHRVPPDKLLEHENGCFLKKCGYSKGDRFLPSPVDPDATTLVKLCADNITKIINDASYCQSAIRTGAAWGSHQPLTLERLQTTYTADERRAIYDAVVDQVPSCHDLSDLAFVSSQDDAGKKTRAKSRLEILAELRDMRRRRTKYRVSAKTRNYSDVLRDVISTQMDLYNQAHNSMNKLHTKTDDSTSCSVLKVVPNEKNTKHYDSQHNRSYHNTEGEISTSSNNTSSIQATQHEKCDIRKRRHNESSYRTERYKYNCDNQSNRRDVTDNSPKSHRKSHKHTDHYESRNRHGEIEYDHKEKNSTKDNSKDRRCDYSEYHCYERHYSNRRRKDHDRNTKSVHKDKDDLDRQKRYDYKQKQKQTLTTKEERGDTHTDDSNSTSNETQFTDVTSYDQSLNSNEKYYLNIKKEGEVYLKKERRGKDFHNKNHRSKSKDKFDHYKQSRRYSRHTTSTYTGKYERET